MSTQVTTMLAPTAANRSGFSMVELLTVIAILTIMAFLAAPLSTSLQQTNNLAFAAQLVTNELAYGREYAASCNQTVYFRFINAAPTANLTGYSYVQLWKIDPANPGNYLAVDRVTKLPTGIEISSNVVLSPLASATNLATGTMPVGSTTAGNTFCYFTIRPDGNVMENTSSTASAASNLPNYFFTILPTSDDGNFSLPKNYVTIQVNPDTASTQIYRP